MLIPLQKPSPPRLEDCRGLFAEIDQSGSFTNFGPMVRRFEAEMAEQVFGGSGSVLTVNNATIGLMLAIKEAVHSHKTAGRRYALMPSFTFAATAHAAIWAGLTPLFCDIDPQTWLPCAAQEADLLNTHADEIAVIVPYATFGNALDLGRYLSIRARTGIPVVVDAAPSLGSRDSAGRQFGAAQPLPIVYSLHATKIFSTGEGGLIYSNDDKTIANLRAMSNFGFTEPRTATLPGLNAKMSEYAAAQAISQLARFSDVVSRRQALVDRYVRHLPAALLQRCTAQRPVYQFLPLLCAQDPGLNRRDAIVAKLSDQGIALGKYFSPALHQQPYFADIPNPMPLDATESVAGRILSLPLFDTMSDAQVDTVLEALLPYLEFAP